MKKISAYAYFITLRTYGSWIHGNPKGSVTRQNNIFNTPRFSYCKKWQDTMQNAMQETRLALNKNQRETLLQSMVNTCHYNHWRLLAAHVRVDHAHLVLQSAFSKEETMGKIKCYATKELKKNYPVLRDRTHFWSRHGSTKNIWIPEEIFYFLYYVVRDQGKPMALYYDQQFYDSFDEELYEIYRAAYQ